MIAKLRRLDRIKRKLDLWAVGQFEKRDSDPDKNRDRNDSRVYVNGKRTVRKAHRPFPRPHKKVSFRMKQSVMRNLLLQTDPLLISESTKEQDQYQLPSQQPAEHQRRYNGSIAFNNELWCVDIKFSPRYFFIRNSTAVRTIAGC